MKNNDILLLLLAAVVALGGFLLSLGIDVPPQQQTEAVEIMNCASAYPEWDDRVCQGVASGRYTTQQVLANPTWNWAAIGAGQLELGMTPPMVEAAWGAPDYVNESGNGGYDEEWAANDRLLQFSGGYLVRMSFAQVWTVGEVLSLIGRSGADWDLKTRNRPLLLLGKVSDIGTENDGSPRLEFESSSAYGEIQCTFSPARSGEVGAIRRGQEIVVLGTGDGIGLYGPTIRDCRVFAAPYN